MKRKFKYLLLFLKLLNLNLSHTSHQLKREYQDTKRRLFQNPVLLDLVIFIFKFLQKSILKKCAFTTSDT